MIENNEMLYKVNQSEIDYIQIHIKENNARTIQMIGYLISIGLQKSDQNNVYRKRKE